MIHDALTAGAMARAPAAHTAPSALLSAIGYDYDSENPAHFFRKQLSKDSAAFP